MSDVERLNQEIQDAQERIDQIKQELMQIGDMRPGNLTEQKHPSKSPNHPYYQLSFTHNSRSRTEYIREAFVDDIRKQLDEYETFKQLTAQWTESAIAKATAQLKLMRATTPRAKRRKTPKQQ